MAFGELLSWWMHPSVRRVARPDSTGTEVLQVEPVCYPSRPESSASLSESLYPI